MPLDRAGPPYRGLVDPGPPTELWREHGTWSAEAEALHGIRREELDYGMPPGEVISALNAIIGQGVAFCDGGASDLAWCRRLVLAGRVANSFRMGDVDMLFHRCDHPGYVRLVRWLDRTPARHRARDDAERLMKALARGLGLRHGEAVNIDLGTFAPGEDGRFDAHQLLAAKAAVRCADDEAVASGRVSGAEMRRRNDWLREFDIANAPMILDDKRRT